MPAWLTSRFAVDYDMQFLRECCLPPASLPIRHRTDLSISGRCAVLEEMSPRREVIEAACRRHGRGRVNDEILANTDAHLCAHLCSHYHWEALMN